MVEQASNKISKINISYYFLNNNSELLLYYTKYVKLKVYFTSITSYSRICQGPGASATEILSKCQSIHHDLTTQTLLIINWYVTHIINTKWWSLCCNITVCTSLFDLLPSPCRHLSADTSTFCSMMKWHHKMAISDVSDC